jgi:hypothetical protein
VLTGEKSPANEYELQERLKWQYYAEQNPQSDDLDIDAYISDPQHQRDAHDIWIEHGMENAFRSVLAQRREEDEQDTDGEKKTAPSDEPAEDEEISSTQQYVPGISLDDVMRRRAERQMG